MRILQLACAAFALARLVPAACADVPEMELWAGPKETADLRAALAQAPVTGAEVKRQALEEEGGVSGKIETPRTLVRVRGLLVPPVSGDHRFALAADDQAVLLLSSDARPFQRREIARVESWTQPGKWDAQPGKWDAQPGQTSEVVKLEAGKPVYFELLAWNFGKTGHLALGWKAPGAGDFSTVKWTTESGAPQVLRYVAGQEDADDDGLPDVWQKEHGLTAADGGSSADPDRDGATNLEEFHAGTDPRRVELGGKVWRETWSGLPWEEANRQRFRFGDAGFPRSPGGSFSVGGIKPVELAHCSLQKFRGYLTPPESGRYRFHLRGQGRVRFELSPDERVLAKQVTVDGGITMQGEPVPLDKPGAFPDSAWISLEAGKRCYFEVYYWIERKPLQIRWEWTRPDGQREAVPASAMTSFTPPPEDADQDDLPDAWEREMGLSVASEATQDFATGDPDHDGLTSGEEYLLRTNPRAADTDRDGVDDGLEIRVLGTSPRDRSKPLEKGPALDLFAARPLTYGWSKAPGGSYANVHNQPAPQPDPNQPSLVNSSGCGSAEWDFTVEKAGFHVVSCEFQLLGYLDGHLSARSQWWIDGEALPEVVTQVPMMALQRAAFLTPRLTAGKHTLKLRLRTTHQLAPTRIFSLKMDRVTDGALGEVTRHLARSNRFTRGTGESPTSPACVEAVSRLEEMPTWRVGGKTARANRSDAWNSWLDVDLPEDGREVPVEIITEKGAVALTDRVKWVPTDVLARPAMTVRQGDRLRLTVAAGAGEGSRSLECDGRVEALSPGQCRIWTASTPGVHRLTGRWQGTDGAGTKENTLVVTVVPDFGNADAGWTRVDRSVCWVDAPGLGRVIDGDERVIVSPAPDSGRIGLSAKAAGDWVLPVRAGEGGPRLGSIILHACKIGVSSRMHLKTFETGALVENPPPGSRLRLVIFSPQNWLPSTSVNGETDAWAPAKSVNEEDLVFFYARCVTKKPSHYIHDLFLAMPDGSEW